MSNQNRFNTALLLLFIFLIASLAACGPSAPANDEGETAVSTPNPANPFLDNEEGDGAVENTP